MRERAEWASEALVAKLILAWQSAVRLFLGNDLMALAVTVDCSLRHSSLAEPS